MWLFHLVLDFILLLKRKRKMRKFSKAKSLSKFLLDHIDVGMNFSIMLEIAFAKADISCRDIK